MSKKITQITQDVYEYLLNKNLQILKKEGGLVPTCYAISFDPKMNMSVMPIPLSSQNSADDRRTLMVEMSKIFKREKIKVKMFMLITEAWMSKIDKKIPDGVQRIRPSEDPNKIEAIICSARDCFNNARYQIFKITRDENKKIIKLEEDETGVISKWVKQNANDFKWNDSLLDSFWSEYRSTK